MLKVQSKRPQSGLTAGDGLDFEGWGMWSEIKGHNEMIKETNLAEQVFAEIGRKAGFNLDHIRADQEFYIVVINLGPGARDHAAQITLRTTLNLYSYLLANPRLKETIIGAAVHDRFKSLADSVTVNDFDREYGPPNELLLGNASITEGE